MIRVRIIDCALTDTYAAHPAHHHSSPVHCSSFDPLAIHRAIDCHRFHFVEEKKSLRFLEVSRGENERTKRVR